MKRSPALVLAGLLVLVAALPAAAQEGHWLGIKGGGIVGTLDLENDLYKVQESNTDTGYAIGLAWEGGISGRWTVEAEAFYVHRTSTSSYDADSSLPLEDGEVHYTFETIEIPFHVKYSFADGATRPFLLAGWVTAIPLEVMSETDYYYVEGPSEHSIKDHFDDVWLAWEVGAGLDHRVNSGVSLGLEVRYKGSLQNIGSVEGESWKWNNFRAFANVKFNL